jgi:hypothetical protein
LTATAPPTGPGGSAAARSPNVWGDPRVWLRYIRELLGGERLRRPGIDTLQLGADFIVDPQRIITYARAQQRDDRPPVAELLRALERAAHPAD